MINFEATSVVSADDKNNGLELVITRTQGESDGVTASFDYDLNYNGGGTSLYLGGRIIYPDGRSGSKKEYIIKIDSENMKSILAVKREIHNEDKDYDFLKGIADGMTKTFELGQSPVANTNYMVYVAEKTFAYMNIAFVEKDSRFDNGDIILANLRVSTN